MSDSKQLETAMAEKTMKQHTMEQGFITTCVKCKERETKGRNWKTRQRHHTDLGWDGKAP